MSKTKFTKTYYDLLPTSSTLVYLDAKLSVQNAINLFKDVQFALIQNSYKIVSIPVLIKNIKFQGFLQDLEIEDSPLRNVDDIVNEENPVIICDHVPIAIMCEHPCVEYDQSIKVKDIEVRGDISITNSGVPLGIS